MTAKLLDGKATSVALRAQLGNQVEAHLAKGHRPPGLAVILIGDDHASQIYVRKKCQACKEAKFFSRSHNLAKNTSEENLIILIDRLNSDDDIDGILVQLPLPDHIDTNKILERIVPNKDVDGFHPYNLGRLTQKRPSLRPCTPYGVIQLLNHYDINLRGLNTTIVGASNVVGRPMGLELLLAGCTVTTCHRFTKDLATPVGNADLLVVAMGKRGILQSHWVKPGAIVVDVAINRTEEGKITGDVEFDSAKEIASWITPVPGGVGPMTVTMLLSNTLYAYENFYLAKQPT